MTKNSTIEKELIWHEDKCKLCDVCQKVCPQQGIRLTKGKLITDKEKCNLCGICEMYCPDDAIEIKKKE